MYSYKFHKPDYVFVGMCLGVLIFGLFMLSSATAPVAISRFGNSYHFVIRQFLFGILPGSIIFLFLLRLDYRKLKSLKWVYYGLANLLLVSVFMPFIGAHFNKAQSWIEIGGFSLQPAEFAKLFFILFVAAWLDDKNSEEDIRTLKGFLKFTALFSLPAFLLILQPDIGTLGVLFAIFFLMAFSAGAKIKHLGALGALGFAGFIGLILKAPYRAARLMTFLHPELDPQGIGYHINQALLAIGSGGFLGLGFGNSRQKFQYLPEVAGDSIFAVIGEELGFIFTVAVVIIFYFILLRCIKIARKAPDIFGKLLVSGVGYWIAVQALMNIGAMVGLLPLTGVPLPLISHGGSAMLSILISLGLVAAVSRRTID